MIFKNLFKLLFRSLQESEDKMKSLTSELDDCKSTMSVSSSERNRRSNMTAVTSQSDASQTISSLTSQVILELLIFLVYYPNRVINFVCMKLLIKNFKKYSIELIN